MRRYTYRDGRFYETESGEWVMFEDMKSELAAIVAEILSRIDGTREAVKEAKEEDGSVRRSAEPPVG